MYALVSSFQFLKIYTIWWSLCKYVYRTKLITVSISTNVAKKQNNNRKTVGLLRFTIIYPKRLLFCILFNNIKGSWWICENGGQEEMVQNYHLTKLNVVDIFSLFGWAWLRSKSTRGCAFNIPMYGGRTGRFDIISNYVQNFSLCTI